MLAQHRLVIIDQCVGIHSLSTFLFLSLWMCCSVEMEQWSTGSSVTGETSTIRPVRVYSKHRRFYLWLVPYLLIEVNTKIFTHFTTMPLKDKTVDCVSSRNQKFNCQHVTKIKGVEVLTKPAPFWYNFYINTFIVKLDCTDLSFILIVTVIFLQMWEGVGGIYNSQKNCDLKLWLA